MSTSDTTALSQIIQEAITAEDPVEDTLVEIGEEDTDDIDDIVKSLLEADDEPELEEDEDGEDKEEETDERLEDTFQVKVDGEVVEVTLKEALAGYQRQADYTRKAQALATEREQLEAAAAEFGDVIQTVENLESAWEENPVNVLTHFASNTPNPTHSVALLIKELAAANLLEQDFMDMFGITPDVRKAWAKESEVDTLRRKVNQTETKEAKSAQEREYEAQVSNAIVEYDRQIDEILESENVKNLNETQRAAFRQKLATYAYDNELTNLKAAYKALKYEESQKKAKATAKAKERAQGKKNAPAVGRSGAGSTGASAVVDSNDLSAIIRSAMDEASSQR
jgi:hypothetical protein